MRNKHFFRLLLFVLFLFAAAGFRWENDSIFQVGEKKEEANLQQETEVEEVETVFEIQIAEEVPSKTIKIVSWNIQHMGRTKTPEVILEIAKILRSYDLVAIQEVVAKDPAGAQAVARLADELNRMGFQWDYQVSDPTRSPSGNLSERYAFLWKPSRVRMIHRAKLDKELEDLCYREPFVGQFQIRGEDKTFYVANYHSRKYTDRPEEEIVHLLDYPERLVSENILIAGDFNLNERHEVWEPFYRKGFRSAVKDSRTTLKRKCAGENYLNHPIDNIFYSKGIRWVSAGTIDFVGSCENLEEARRISDHLPVFMEFGLDGGGLSINK